MPSKSDDIDPDSLARETRAAVDKLSQETERLKKLSELQSLKGNQREISVDLDGLLSMESNKDAPPPPAGSSETKT